jgi:hypothetical protein
MKLLTVGNPKTLKGEKQGYITAVLHLAPASTSGFNVCPMATQGCKAGCLNTAGRGGIAAGNKTFASAEGALPDNAIQRARIKRTQWFFDDRPAFMLQLSDEIFSFVRKARIAGLIPVVRLNGTSDIRWENQRVSTIRASYINLMEMFPDVQFYDYTKLTNRRNVPANYHLTFSLAENNDAHAASVLAAGGNVAVVYRDKAIPQTYTIAGTTRDVVSGDDSDLRFLDPQGVIVGLYAKGRAKKDALGFVRPN